MVRDTAYDTEAYKRMMTIYEWLHTENIPGRTIIIPDIHGVYYGRGVGYEVEEIQVPDEIKQISGTKIRQSLKNH